MINNLQEVVESYRTAGFSPFPLVPGTKIPPKDCVLATADTTCAFLPESNIGLLTGSSNNFAVIDADNDMAKAYILNKLYNMGIADWLTIVSTPNKNGYHFWIKLVNRPTDVQVFYKLPASVGSGEFRIRRPAYVVAPPSVVDAGQYKFVQGNIEFFTNQIEIEWSDLTWLVPHTVKYGAVEDQPKSFDNIRKYNENPHVLKILEELAVAEKGDTVRRINFKTGDELPGVYPSRSEAEFSVVLSLLMAGWDFDKICEAFDEYKPGHYINAVNPYKYLVNTFNKAVAMLSK